MRSVIENSKIYIFVIINSSNIEFNTREPIQETLVNLQLLFRTPKRNQKESKKESSAIIS